MTENPDYIRCLEGSHLGLVHKYAGIGDGIYSNWDYSNHKSYIQANFAARFVGELVAPFHLLSLVHKSTALSEVAKQKLVYQQWLHIPVTWKEGAWGECMVDDFVEGVVGLLTKVVVFEPDLFSPPAKYRDLQPSENPLARTWVEAPERTCRRDRVRVLQKMGQPSGPHLQDCVRRA